MVASVVEMRSRRGKVCRGAPKLGKTIPPKWWFDGFDGDLPSVPSEKKTKTPYANPRHVFLQSVQSAQTSKSKQV